MSDEDNKVSSIFDFVERKREEEGKYKNWEIKRVLNLLKQKAGEKPEDLSSAETEEEKITAAKFILLEYMQEIVDFCDSQGLSVEEFAEELEALGILPVDPDEGGEDG